MGVPRSAHCHSWSRVRLASMNASARSEVSRTVSSKSASPPMSRQAIRTISRRRSRRRSGISASIDPAARAVDPARSRSDGRPCVPAAEAGYGASRSPLETRSASIAGSRSQLEKTKSEQASTRAASPGRASVSSPSTPAASAASRSPPCAASGSGNGASPRQSRQFLLSFIGSFRGAKRLSRIPRRAAAPSREARACFPEEPGDAPPAARVPNAAGIDGDHCVKLESLTSP